MNQLANWLYPLGRFTIAMIAIGVLALSSCEYDDSDLKSAMEALNERLAKLELATKQAQADISNLQVILNAMKNQLTVTSVIENEDGSYSITFSDGKKITIGGGDSGVAQPTISVVEENGDYYWVYVLPDGSKKFVTDDKGNRIKANGEEGTAPQLRINEKTDEWEMSVDGGKTWQSLGVKAVGEDGDSFFQSVTSDDDYIYITLIDGTQFKVLRAKELIFVFSTEKVQYFGYGDEKTVPVQMSGVSKHTISKPDGWRAVLTADGMKITAPVEANTYAEQSGLVAVVAVGTNGQSVIAELPVKIGMEAPAIDLSAAETANSYLVAAPGNYRFNATIQGNGTAGAVIEDYTFPDYVPRMSPVSSKVLWMTQKDLITDVALNGDYIEFSVDEPMVAGNALVAALGVSGETLWSWHIWIAEFDPNVTMQVYDNGFKMMDRNLGALANIPGDVGAIGTFYQWGRKDPFIGPDKMYTSNPGPIDENNTCRMPVYDVEGNQLDPFNDFPILKSTGDGTIGSVTYATAHPTTFIMGKNASDWYDGTGATIADRNNYLWGNPKGHLRKDVRALKYTEASSGSTRYLYSDTIRTRVDNAPGRLFSYYYDVNDKTKVYSFASSVTPAYETGKKSIYDPCPPGWRMPQSGMWAGYNGASPSDQLSAPWNYTADWDGTKMGRMFKIGGAGTAWYQCTGYLNSSSGKFSAYDASRYWCSDVSSKGNILSYKEPETNLYYGYYYRFTDEDVSTSAAYLYFTEGSFGSRMIINSYLSKVDGETKPTVTNAARIGGQEIGGGAVRAYGYNVRCMKAE